MGDRNGASLFGRVALLLLTVYALAMIAPDLLRVVRPLGSFGLAMDGDGRIYDVQGPFESEDDSPAWRAGLRAGDRLDLAAMRCAPVDTIVCASLLSQWGGVTYVTAGREATLVVAVAPERPGREVRLTAEPRPTNRLLDVVVVLDTIAGVLVVLGAAWLVWTRPGLMTWGFFVYVIQFNPGQAFQFWAWLQLWPRALLAQNVIFLVMQAAAYTGLLLFALRAPVDRAEGRWRTIERALPALAIVFLAVALASMATVFGYPAEIWARSMLFIGFAVSVGALAILIGRRRDLSPRDYQRIRWVIWGCLIGLPAYLLAQLSQETSLFGDLLGDGQAPEEAAGALSLVNGILCLFVVEAVRRPDGGQRLDPASPGDRLRPSAQRAGPVPPQADRGDRRVHPHARLGLGRGRFRSRLPDRARTRVCDRAHGPPVRPQIHPRRAPSRRRGRDHSEFRQPRRDRAAPGERADAVRSAWRRRRCFASRTAYSAEASAPDGTPTTPIRSPAIIPCSPRGSTESPTPSIRSTPPTPRLPSFRTTSSGRFSSCRSAMRVAATRSSSMAGMRSEPILTRASATCSAASPATPRSLMRRSKARRCGGGSPCWRMQLAKTLEPR